MLAEPIQPCGGNLETPTCSVPGERWQARQEHGVPVNGRAIEIHSQAKELAEEDRGLSFSTGRRRETSSDMVYKALLRRLDIPSFPMGSAAVSRTGTRNCIAEMIGGYSAKLHWPTILAMPLKPPVR